MYERLLKTFDRNDQIIIEKKECVRSDSDVLKSQKHVKQMEILVDGFADHVHYPGISLMSIAFVFITIVQFTTCYKSSSYRIFIHRMLKNYYVR